MHQRILPKVLPLSFPLLETQAKCIQRATLSPNLGTTNLSQNSIRMAGTNAVVVYLVVLLYKQWNNEGKMIQLFSGLLVQSRSASSFLRSDRPGHTNKSSPSC